MLSTQRLRAAARLALLFAVACDGPGSAGDTDGGRTPSGDAGRVIAPMPDAMVSPPVTVDALPTLPGMSNVRVTPGDHSMVIEFDPVEGAADYRVYAVPEEDAVLVDSSNPDRLVGVQDAVYRCAGTQEAPPVGIDWHEAPNYNNCEVAAVIDSSMPYVEHCGTNPSCYPTAGGDGNWFGEGGYPRQPSEIQLGFVYTTEGPGRVAVRAFGDPSAHAYSECNGRNWTATRNKRYTSDATEWPSLRAAGWLDYGVQFYVPTEDSADTQPLYLTPLATDQEGVDRHYYYLDGPERAFRTGRGQAASVAFRTLRTATPLAADGAPTAQPLYRVLYSVGFGHYQHDELAVGRARFDALYGQGPARQRHSVTFTWAGEPPAGLVLEALDEGCPFQGHLTTHEAAPVANLFDAWTTLDAVRDAAPYGEVYVNGQYDGTQPSPIARAFVGVASQARAPLDFATNFASADPTFETLTVECNEGNYGCDAGTLRVLQSADFDVTFVGVEPERWSLQGMFGQLWVTYSDVGADVSGLLRMTARHEATMSEDAYLYVTMDVNSMSTARRYPQIIIHDSFDTPLWIAHRSDDAATNGRSLIVQSFRDWPSRVSLEVCTNRGWAVNDQCPETDLASLPNDRRAPVYEQGERAGADIINRFEVYASTRRAYVFFDNEPYGCTDFAPNAVPSGEVRVTFGDALYHSGADDGIRYILEGGFHHDHHYTLAERRFSALGFSNGVAAPEWDESRFPCVEAE